MTVDRPVTVVFVPGAWAGAWCFDPVLARLTAAGVSAIALDLPGRGADRGELTDLAAHVLCEDESCMAAALEEATVISHDGRPDLGAHLVLHPDGVSTLDEGVAPLFYGQLPTRGRRLGDGTAGPAAGGRPGPRPARRHRPGPRVMTPRPRATSG